MITKNLKYSELVEHESCNSWDKDTIAYVIENKSKVDEMIYKHGKNTINSYDIDSIYSDVIMYFYTAEDYDIAIAAERSSSSELITIEGYISSCVRFCVLRYIHQRSMDKTVSIDALKDDSDIPMVDMIASSDKIEIEQNLGDILEECQCYRYKYGVDLFQVVYIHVLGIRNNIESKKIKNVLAVFGITAADLDNIEIYNNESPAYLISKAISYHKDIDNAIEILSKYVYCADKIKQAVLG